MSVKGDWPRKCQTSREEQRLRKDYFWGDINITEKEMKKRIAEIRKRKGKP